MADEDQLREALRALARDSRAPCRALLALAERLGAPPAEVGQLCNEMRIKIVHCQLGCFGDGK